MGKKLNAKQILNMIFPFLLILTLSTGVMLPIEDASAATTSIVFDTRNWATADTTYHLQDARHAVYGQFCYATFLKNIKLEGNQLQQVDDARIYRIDLTNGQRTVIAGTGQRGYSGDGGPALNAQIDVHTVAVDNEGNIYFTDLNKKVIRKINTRGIITTIAGGGVNRILTSNTPVNARDADLEDIQTIAPDRHGNVYIASKAGPNSFTNRILKIDTQNKVTWIAGSRSSGTYKSNCPAVDSAIWALALAVDGTGNVYFIDKIDKMGANIIRKVSPQGYLTIAAGSWAQSAFDVTGDNGPATQARLGSVHRISIDAQNNLYMLTADRTLGHVLRKVNAQGIITTVASNLPILRDALGVVKLDTLYYGNLPMDLKGNFYYSGGVDVKYSGTLLYKVDMGSLVAAPLKPTLVNLRATPGNMTVTLNWSAYPAYRPIAGFNIYRGAAAKPLNATPINAFSLVDRMLTNGVKYYYTVYPVFADGSQGASSNIVLAIPGPATSRTLAPTQIPLNTVPR